MAQLGWDFAPETARTIRKFSELTNGKIRVQLRAASGPLNWKKLMNGKYKEKALAALEEYGFLDWAKATFPSDF